MELSRREETTFEWSIPELTVRRPVRRAEFAAWIGRDLALIERCLEGLLRDASVRPESVGSVFLTGGSALVPAVRQLFARWFTESKLRGGAELTSVARGLALRGGSS